MFSNPDTIIEQARDLSVEPQNDASSGALTVSWLARAGMFMPPWWSPQRDTSLRNFWKKVDYLAGAIYTLEARMTSIPFRVVARDPSNKEHVLQAEKYTEILQVTPQYGEGWNSFFASWLEDFLTQDNGGFAEVIGDGNKSGPIVGMPYTVAHLDANRCQRTGDAEFPIIYLSSDSKRYKLHFSRVMYASQMRSPIREMLGVGLCSVSRCVNIAQSLLDILTYKQEKLGSRPHRAILVPHGGLDPKDVRTAFQLAENSMDAQGMSRYSKIVVAGSSSLPEAGIDIIELASLPDGFMERDSVELGIAAIALAFGMDARELFPSMQAGATRADALLQHLKQRGKGPGQIIQTAEMMFNQKYLPPHLMMVFDFQDDAQDRQVADTKKVRADRRVQDKMTGAVTQRIMREQMVESGDLTRGQFERLELMDGRLPDGTSVLALFYSKDKDMKSYLDLGVSDPLDQTSNNLEAMQTVINEKLREVQSYLVDEEDSLKKSKAFQAVYALIYLNEYYQNPLIARDIILGTNPQLSQPMQAGMPIEGRVRTEPPGTPNPNTEGNPNFRAEMLHKPEVATR